MRETLYIGHDGEICGLSNSLFDKLGTLGPKVVSRVSNIEFNHTLQMWEAIDTDENLIGRSTSREALIELEKEYLNRTIEESYEKNKNSNL
jgi:hypothetical protein